MRRRVALAAALALTAAGCAGGAGPSPGERGDALTVRHLREEEVLGSTRLDCEGADRPVCRRVAALLPSLRPRPNEICTEIYGGPWRIALSGRLDGRPVDLVVSRRNGCEIARYDRLAEALGPAAPPPRPGITGAG